MSWILFTIFAALMQSIRTAGQKVMGARFSPMGNTCVRFLFGLPFAALYYFILLKIQNFSGFELDQQFIIFASLTGICQICGTALQVYLLGVRNFATGTVFVKSEVMLTALIGFTFFDDVLGLQSWIGVVLCSMGIMLLGFRRQHHFGWKSISVLSILIGMGAGLSFSLASLFIRKASHSLNSDFLLSAATSLLFVVTMQTILMVLYLTFFERNQWKAVLTNKPQALFIGATSIAGSIGWFTAMTLIPASFVRALGQVEVIYALLITFLFFREKPGLLEYVGIITITAGVFFVIL